MSVAATPTPPSAPIIPRHNVPPATSALFGREAELGRLHRALRAARLVTLTGPGGVGKTRLALAAAHGLLDAYMDGVWLVELAPLTEPDLVPSAVAAVLGVREQPGRALAETLASWLRARQLLLVLDNCEHVREACAQLAETLLGEAPGLRVLATGRTSLGLAGERRLAVPPLTLPTSREAGLEEVGATPAVALFVARAQVVEPSFALDEENAGAVAAICARLDGLPLAIELAAARIKVRTPRALLDELGERLEVLIGGRRGLPARQRTVRGLLDWSFTLLSPGEQALFARLSVFAGGWTVEAAQAVCAIVDDLPMSAEEGLASLLEQSLVVPPRDGRYAMLETVREYAGYALERLSAEGDAEAARRQHLACFLVLAERAAPHLTGPEQATWLERLEAEHDNLRAALDWARDSGAGEEALRLAGHLWPFWERRGHLTEGRSWLDVLLSGADGVAPAVRARALTGAGALAYDQGDYDRAVTLQEQALELRRGLGDKSGIAVSLNNLGNVASMRGDFARAASLHEEALALRRELGDRMGSASSLGNLAAAAHGRGDYARAVALQEEALALRRELGNRRGIAGSLMNLGQSTQRLGEQARASALYEEALAIFRELGDMRSVSGSLGSLGTLLFEMGDYDRAAALHEEALALRRELGDRMGIASSLGNLGNVEFGRGKYGRAAALFAETLQLCRDIGAQEVLAQALERLVHVAAARGQARPAAVMGGASEALRERRGASLVPVLVDDHQVAVAAMRVALGEAAFAAAWDEGRELPLDAAIALALEWHAEGPGVSSPFQATPDRR